MLQLLWKTIWQYESELKIHLSSQPATQLLRMYATDKCMQKCVYKSVQSGIVSTNSSCCSSIDRVIIKFWNIHTTYYHVAFKKNEVEP